MIRAHFIRVLVGVLLVALHGSHAAEVFRPRPGFAPRFELVEGSVETVCAAAGGQYYVGGEFSGLGLANHSSIARFHGDGTVDDSFRPDAILDGAVMHVAIQADGRVVIAGRFHSVGGQPRSGIARLNHDGSLDNSFQPGSGFPPASDVTGPEIRALVIQADGDIVVAGGFETYDGETSQGLVRINPDGGRDTEFAIGTKLGQLGVNRVAALADGRILVGGSFGTFDGVACNKLIRLNSDASLDAGFAFAATLSVGVYGIGVQSDGKIVVGGSLADPIRPTIYNMARVNADGSFDPSFLPPGDISGGRFTFDAVNRILVAGQTTGGFGFPRAIVRLAANGTIDQSYSPVSAAGESVTSLALLTDGSVVSVWYKPLFPVGTPTRVRRVTESGSIDESLGHTPRSPGTVLAAQPVVGGGWIVGGVFSHVNGVARRGLARLTAAGDLDLAFAPAGSLPAFAGAVLVQPDGSVIAAMGESSFGDTLVRLDATGAIDPGFDTGTGFAGNFNVNLDVLALQPDGRILVGGAFSTFDGAAAPYAVRLNANGTRDATFDPQPDGLVYAVALQSDGKILIGGRFTSVRSAGGQSVERVSLARFNADGTLDASLDPGADFALRVESIATLPDGGLLVSGPPRTFDPAEPQIVRRLLANGAVDATFAAASFPRAQHSAVGLHSSDGYWVGLAGTSFNQILTHVRSAGSVVADLEWHDSTVARLPSAYTSGMGIEVLVPMESGAVAIGGNWLSLGRRAGGGLLVLDPVPGAMITEAPVAQAAQAGGTAVALAVSAVGNGPVTFQWQFSTESTGPFSDLTGATAATLSIPSPQRFHDGFYRVIASANGLSTTSAAVAVTVGATATSPAARLLNLSTRALAQTGDNVLIPGFVISGTQPKKLLIRAVGPSLGVAPFHLPGVLPNPRIVLKRRDEITREMVDVAQNDDWGTNPNFAEIKQTANAVSAFPIPDDSLDAVLLRDLSPGEYTAIAEDVNAASGVAIVELYDADPDGSGSRLINISNRGFVGVGDQVMIPGFVVSSEGPRTFLIRVIGPSLADFGVTGTMADPKLTVYRSNSPLPGDTQILVQDNWSESAGAAETAQVAADVFAFPLASGSKDAAFVVTLPPGLYTVLGGSADGVGTGIALVEVYVAP